MEATTGQWEMRRRRELTHHLLHVIGNHAHDVVEIKHLGHTAYIGVESIFPPTAAIIENHPESVLQCRALPMWIKVLELAEEVGGSKQAHLTPGEQPDDLHEVV